MPDGEWTREVPAVAVGSGPAAAPTPLSHRAVVEEWGRGGARSPCRNHVSQSVSKRWAKGEVPSDVNKVGSREERGRKAIKEEIYSSLAPQSRDRGERERGYVLCSDSSEVRKGGGLGRREEENARRVGRLEGRRGA